MRTRWWLGNLVRGYYANADKQYAAWDQNNGDEGNWTLNVS